MAWGAALAGLFNIGQEIFNRSRVGYETSPQKRAFIDSALNEQRIFNRDSRYNSPSAQMQRFKEAGLNPNLMYGQGTPGTTTGHAVQASGNIERLNLMDGVMQAVVTGKELEFKDAQIANVMANTEYINSRAATEGTRNRRMIQDYEYLVDRYPWLLDELRTDVARKDVQLQDDQTKRDVNLASKQYDIQNRQAQALKANQEFTNLFKQEGLLDKDEKIKAEVLRGKEFQNIILKLQADFLQKGEFNMAQFWQAFIMLLSKSF